MLIKFAQLKIISNCNAKCSFCSYYEKELWKNELKKKDIERIIIQLNNLKIEDVLISGGEPSLHKEFEDIIKYISNNSNSKIGLATNGSNIKKILLILDKLDYINLSIDFVNPSEHNNFRGIKNLYEKNLTLIKKANELGVKVNINKVIMSRNIKDISSLVEITNVHNINKLTLHFVDYFKGRETNKDLFLNVLDTRIFYEKTLFELEKKIKNTIIEVYPKTKINMTLNDYKKIANGEYMINELAKECNLSKKQLIIDFTGEIYPCCVALGSNKHSMGNIKKESLDNIIKSKKYKNLIDEAFSFPFCNRCSEDI